MSLQIADKTFTSRLFTGTGKFSSSQLMREALLASESELITVALKRVDVKDEEDDILTHLNHKHINCSYLHRQMCITIVRIRHNNDILIPMMETTLKAVSFTAP